MAANPNPALPTNDGSEPEISPSEFAARLGISVAEATRVIALKAADPNALSFMPGPKDVLSQDTYDAWIRAKIQQSLDDPRPSLSSEEVKARLAKHRAKLFAEKAK
jgi:DNA-damage-inducible protein J